MRAFLALASEGTDTISLPVGGGRSIEIEALPMTFQSTKGLSDLLEMVEDEEIQLEENIDEPLDDFFIDNEDELA